MSSDPTQTIYVDGSNPPSLQQPVTSNYPAENQNTGNNDPLNPTQAGQGQVFYKIIDVVTEWQRGNFLPALHCLRYNLIPKEFLDFTGYNVLHHAVSQGSVPITLILLDYFKIDVNIRSGNNQTPLMIACNYGLIDIIRILCERGAFINEQDDTKFSALLYTIKQGRIPQFAYLLHQKAELQVRDANGCTAVHWAAYKNNVFLLKILHRLGLDLNSVDFTGLTPIDRAAQSGAFEATKFLLENGDGKKPANMKYDQISSSDIKELLRQKYFPTRWETTSEKAVNTIKKNSQMITAGIYSFLWIVMMAIFLRKIVNQLFMYDIFFFIFSLFFISYSLWYYLKSHGSPNKTKVFAYQSLHASVLTDDSQDISMARAHSTSKLSFEALDKLVKGEHKGSVIHEGEVEGYASFLHELAALFENKNYKEIARFNEKDYCPVCLIKRPQRSGHCEETRTCVPHFQHYSACLGTTINNSDHYLYMILLLLQTIQLTLFILGLWVSYADKIKNLKILVIYVGRLLYNEPAGLIFSASYAVLIVIAVYNFVIFSIEIYGVMKNETYYEMFDRANCLYMFRIKQDKKGAFVKSFKNPYDHGIMNNLNEYFGKILHFDMREQGSS